MKPILAISLLLIINACRSPLTELRPIDGRPCRIEVPPITSEDHSRMLKRLRNLEAGEPNTPELRKAALTSHCDYVDKAFRTRAEAHGLALDPEAPFRLELTLTTVGEIRTKYIAYGILSGVAWGVGTGLATHSTKLAVGLGSYELIEESVFWIAGSSVFGRYSAPVVLEARLREKGKPKPLWTETYYVIWGGKHLKDFPVNQGKDRSVQIHASLERALDKLFQDLDKIPQR